MPFQIGQRVECIYDFPSDVGAKWCKSVPVLGGIYHVRHIGVGWLGAPCIMLQEILNPAPNEPMFLASDFRPLIERKTDISVFEEILRRETEKPREPVRA